MREHAWERVERSRSSHDLCRRCGMTSGHAFSEFCSVTWKPECLSLPGEPVNPGVRDCDYEVVRRIMES